MKEIEPPLLIDRLRKRLAYFLVRIGVASVWKAERIESGGMMWEPHAITFRGPFDGPLIYMDIKGPFCKCGSDIVWKGE